MSDKKIEYVDLTEPIKTDGFSKAQTDRTIEQLADIIFVDCGKGGVLYGLDTESTAVAVLAAGEALVWFSRLAGKIDDDGMEEIREKARKLAAKKREYFKDTGLEELIKSAGEVSKKIKERAKQEDSNNDEGGEDE